MPFEQPDSAKDGTHHSIFSEMVDIYSPTAHCFRQKVGEPSGYHGLPVLSFLDSAEKRNEKFGITNESNSHERVIEIRNMRHGSAPHSTADALVRIPPSFDPSKPINIVVYNHGFGSTVSSSYQISKIGEQMKVASPNTILIMPEWQEIPNSRNASQGKFAQPGMFKAMLQEIFDKTPELHGKSIKDVANIHVIGHSAGYMPTMTEIYNNDLKDKIRSIGLLDANYTAHGFDKWISENMCSLQRGEKAFYNIFHDSTKANSKEQADMVKRNWNWNSKQSPGLSPLIDYSSSERVLSHADLRTHPVAFVYSSKNSEGLGQHFTIPMLYFQVVLRASQNQKSADI